MRKFLAILLAVLMVVPAFAFTTSAEELSPPPTTQFVPVVTEDNMPAADINDYGTLAAEWINGILWRNRGNQPMLYDNGAKAVYYNVPANSTAAFGFHFKCDPRVNFQNMTTICFDMYFSDITAISGIQWKAHMICSDKTVYLWATAAEMAEWSGITLANGWNHFEIPVGCFDGETSGVLHEFMIYRNNGTFTKDVKVMFKNVYFINDIVPTVMSSTFGYHNVENGANLQTAWTDKPNIRTVGGDNLWATTDRQLTYDKNNHAASFTRTGVIEKGTGVRINLDWAKIDVRKTNKLCLDMYISNLEYANAENAVWKFEIHCTDTTAGTANYGNNASLTLSQCAELSGTTLKQGWNHFELPYSAFGQYCLANMQHSKRAPDYVRFYINDGTNLVGKEETQLTFKVRNVYFAGDDTAWNSILPVIMATDMLDVTTEANNMHNWHRQAGPSGKDSNPRWSSPGNHTLVYDKASGGVGFTLTKELAYQNGFQMNISNTNISAMDKICFDMYISDLEAANVQNAKWRLKTFHTSSKTRTLDGKTLVELAAMSGATLAQGWNHFEIPMSAFDLPANNSNAVTYITFVYNEKVNKIVGTADAPLQFMLRDIYFEAASGVVGIAPVPTLKNSFNLDFAVKTSGVLYTPIIDVTLGDTTTRQTLTNGTFAFENILAHRLSDEYVITATVLDTNGDIRKIVFEEYSLKQYGINKLAAADSTEALKRLVSDMLHYGAASQAVIDYNMENLANNVDGILEAGALDTETLASYKIANPINDTRTDVAEGAPKWKGASLVLDSAMCIRFTFTADTKPEKVRNLNDNKLLFINKNEDGSYYVDVPVNAVDFDTKYTLVIDDDQSNTVTYSVNAYIARNYGKYLDNPATKDVDESKNDLNKTATYAEMYDLLIAIYNYGVSADKYAAQ